MIQEQTFKGLWSLPGSMIKLTGFLTFDPADGPRLELVGTFNSYWDHKPHELVLGETTQGWITLLDVRYDSGGSSHVTKTTTAVYRPSMIFSGHRFESIDEIRFTSVSFQVFNLLEWLDIDGLTEERKYSDYEFNYKQPVPIPFNCYEGCECKIEFHLNGQYLNQYYKIQYEQACKVTFQYASKRNYNEILLDIFTFVGFVTLCAYEQSYPKKIDFFDDSLIDGFVQEKLNKVIPQAVECIYQNAFYSPDYKIRKWHQHLIRYSGIDKQFPSIIQKWFDKHKELNQVMNLLLRYFVDKYDFNTEKFMDAVRALEIFHRRNFPNHSLPESDYEKLKVKFSSVPELTPDEEKWIAAKLQHGNEPFLKRRLEDLIKQYSFAYFNERVPDTKKFCRQAVDLRNHFTHFDNSSTSKALTGKELFDLTENLRLLLFSAVFNTIGITSEAFDDTTRNLVY